MSYRTFTRSAWNFTEFAKATKKTVDTGLSLDEARRACERFNKNLTPAQKAKGTRMEFEVQ